MEFLSLGCPHLNIYIFFLRKTSKYDLKWMNLVVFLHFFTSAVDILVNGNISTRFEC